MINHVWSVICEKSIIDNETKNLSLMNCLERLVVTVEPKPGVKISDKDKSKINLPINYEVASFWYRTDSTNKEIFWVKTLLVAPSNDKLNENEKQLEMKKSVERLRSRMRVSGLTLRGSGLYFIKIFIKENKKDKYKQVAKLPLEISLKVKNGIKSVKKYN